MGVIIPAIVQHQQWQYDELVTGHYAMITMPKETAALLASFAK